MESPYLNSGETIILTTDRVMNGEIQYDVILTSQRIALVDSSHASDQPQVIPFASILSVKGGMTPSREPGITLLLEDTSDGAGLQEITLIFLQMPYEDRLPERDRWMKGLIEHIVQVRQEALFVGKHPAPERKGMQPSVRRWVAPEIPEPHSDVAPVQERPTNVILSETQDIVWEASAEGQPAREVDEVPGTSGEVVPEKEKEAGPVSVEATAILQEPALHESEVVAGAQEGSPTVDRIPEMPATRGKETPPRIAPEPGAGPAAETVPLPEEGSPLVPTEAEEEERVPAPTLPEEPEIPEDRSMVTEIIPEPLPGISSLAPDIHLGVPNHVGFPVVAVPDAAKKMDNGTLGELSRTDTPVPAADTGNSSSAIQTGLPESVVFPVIIAEEPEKQLVPEIPPSPPRLPRSHHHMIAIIAAIVFILIVIAGGAFFGFQYVMEKNSGMESSVVSVSPTPAVVPTTSPPAVVIPASGVWVRVTYNGTYAGSIGNPGDLLLISGTGDQFYSIRDSSSLVQATLQKQDLTGNTLTVGVYTNGTLVTNRTVRAPHGTISILVDPTTGKPPYLPTVASP